MQSLTIGDESFQVSDDKLEEIKKSQLNDFLNALGFQLT